MRISIPRELMFQSVCLDLPIAFFHCVYCVVSVIKYIRVGQISCPVSDRVIMLIHQIRSFGSSGSETGEQVFPVTGRKPYGSFRAPTCWQADLINHPNGRAGLDFIGLLAEPIDSIDLSERDKYPPGEIHIKPCFFQ